MISPEFSDAEVQDEIRKRIARIMGYPAHRETEIELGLSIPGDPRGIRLEWHRDRAVWLHVDWGHTDDMVYANYPGTGMPEKWDMTRARKYALPALRRYMVLDDLANI